MVETEVLIVGSGPAGATAAINLAPFRQVILLDRNPSPTARIGESLAPAARRLFSDMGLLESFLSEGHQPWHCNRAVWGGPVPREIDFLSDPDGHGWHLDRARFEQWLRNIAKSRGAELLCPATIDSLEHDGRQWRVNLQTPAGSVAVTANLIIDAGGRAAPIARKSGAKIHTEDRLICCWAYGDDKYDGRRGITYVEAVEDGWWYTAPLPAKRRVLAFHTDADLKSTQILREQVSERFQDVKGLSAILIESGFRPDSEASFTAANSAILDPPTGDGWLAAGDAVIAFDPLSSQGLLNALFTGLAAAEAADSWLRGDKDSLTTYSQTIRDIADAYRRHLKYCYSIEQRWPDSPFWRRRHAK